MSRFFYALNKQLKMAFVQLELCDLRITPEHTVVALQHLVKEYRAGVENGSIGADDIRSKFLRALEAKSMADNGMVVIPEHGRSYV